MRIEAGFSIDFLSLNIGQSRVAEVPQSTASDDARLREQLVLTRRRAGELGQALNELDGLLRAAGASRVGGASRPATATSTADLGLDGMGVATTLQSSNEVNTTPTSFSTFGPDWIGSSAQASLTGTYDGSNGTDTLTRDFRFARRIRAFIHQHASPHTRFLHRTLFRSQLKPRSTWNRLTPPLSGHSSDTAPHSCSFFAGVQRSAVARYPPGTGSAQILRSMSPNSRQVRCPSASRSQ